MANQHGITANDSSPCQEDIDTFFNWCDANPPDVAKKLENMTDEAKKYVKEKLEALKEEAETMLKKYTDGVMDGLKEKEEKLLEMSVAPVDEATTIAWVTLYIKNNIIEPYKKVVEAISWWTNFTTQATSAVTGVVNRTTELLSKLESMATSAASSVTSSATSVV